jgi:XisI protein
VYGSLVHIDIMGDQGILQRDGTERGVAPLLARGGIAPERILLAFHPEGPCLYAEVEAAGAGDYPTARARPAQVDTRRFAISRCTP